MELFYVCWFDKTHRDAVYETFFGSGYNNFQYITEEINKDTGERVKVSKQKPVFSIYDVITTYGTKNQRAFYVYNGEKHGYVEASIEDNLSYIKFSLAEALSSVGIDVTVDQIDDILETQFGGTGILQIKKLLTEKFTLPAKGNTHKAGARVTL